MVKTKNIDQVAVNHSYDTTVFASARTTGQNINNSWPEFDLSANFKHSLSHFREHGWAFIENVFPENVHKCLLHNWPPAHHFNPIRKIHKSYDVNFVDTDKTFKSYPYLDLAEQYFFVR